MQEDQQQTRTSSLFHDLSTHTDTTEPELVRSLREQNHKLFLQINQMERFGRMEVDHIRSEFEEEWYRKEECYKLRLAELEGKLNERSLNGGATLVHLGELDSSNFFEAIQHVNESLRDSGIQKLRQWLTENEKSAADELEQRLGKVERLRSAVFTEFSYLSPAVCSLIQFCNELCVEACGLKEELKNYFDSNEVSKCKIQEAYSLLSKYKLNEARLKSELIDLREEGKFWQGLYESEVERKEQAENTLMLLEKKVHDGESENQKLQEIIKDQSSRLELLSHPSNSLLNENCEVNGNRSRISSSEANVSTLSNFLEKALQKSPKKQDRQEKELRYSYRRPCESPVNLNMFKKKPFLGNFQN